MEHWSHTGEWHQHGYGDCFRYLYGHSDQHRKWLHRHSFCQREQQYHAATGILEQIRGPYLQHNQRDAVRFPTFWRNLWLEFRSHTC